MTWTKLESSWGAPRLSRFRYCAEFAVTGCGGSETGFCSCLINYQKKRQVCRRQSFYWHLWTRYTYFTTPGRFAAAGPETYDVVCIDRLLVRWRWPWGLIEATYWTFDFTGLGSYDACSAPRQILVSQKAVTLLSSSKFGLLKAQKNVKLTCIIIKRYSSDRSLWN